MKKGFTLIEIVAVIAVVSILLVILTPYLLNSVNNKKNEVSNVAKKMIYDAADIYIKDNNEIYTSDEGATYCIKLETLVNSGKLMNPIKDMKKNKEVPLNYYVKATANSYNQFDYELVDNKSCDEKLPISISYKMDSQYEKIKKVTITYPEGNYIKKYKIISGETEENIELNKEITVTDSEISLNFKNNGKLEAILLNGTTNDEIIRKTINITKVDNTSPKVTSSKIDKLGKIVYTISDSESGLKDYCINNTNSTDDCEWVKINNYPLIYTFTYTASKVNNYYIHIRDKFDNTFISQTPVKITNSNLCQYDVKKTWTFNYTGSEQSFTVPCTGNYKMETWGAQGGNTTLTSYGGTGGKGSYASGVIGLNADKKIYIYVGGKGTDGNNSRDTTLNAGGYNGGGNNGSLDSASPAGGGGGGSGISNVGAPGGVNSGVYGNLYGGNGTSTSGGAAGTGYSHDSKATKGTFGVGGNSGLYVTGAGGAGFYGGGGGNHYTPSTSGGGGGGSSFISGHNGCNAISENSTASNITHTNQSVHYSGLKFTQTVMKAGNEAMPSHDGKSTMTGNSGNGYAKITYLGD